MPSALCGVHLRLNSRHRASFLSAGIMPQYFDISVPVSARTTVYPGDPVPQIEWPTSSHAAGDACNVGSFAGGFHTGTHVDAPWHFIGGGRRLGDVPLEHWLGPCWVADLDAEPKCVTAEALDRAGVPADTRRLLLKTRNSRRDYWHEAWDPHFIYVHRSAAQWCVDRGILTLGLDYLTIDPPGEANFPAHRTLLGHGVTVLETLNLRGVPAGAYELLAAPVHIPEADGAWCRAILRAAD